MAILFSPIFCRIPQLPGYRTNYWEVQAVVLNHGQVGEMMRLDTLESKRRRGRFFCDFRGWGKPFGFLSPVHENHQQKKDAES